MRFLGNKESLLSEIEQLLREKNLINNHLVFFDAFCGSGAISNHYKQYFNIISNDNLKWSTIYTKGRVVAPICTFQKLNINPIDFLNKTTEKRKGFFYKTYCPSATSSRMYFSVENAQRIDYFREQIEDWKQNNLINEDEYAYLLACLIESVSAVSNTAGVYGAFLKHWDARALKPIEFIEVETVNCDFLNVQIFNDKIENIISKIDCDILYLAPPPPFFFTLKINMVLNIICLKH